MKEVYFATVLALLAIVCVPAAAQSPTCSYQYQFFCGDSFLPGTVSCQTEGSCLAVCTVLTNKCVPPGAASETALGPCKDGVCSKPISLASGNTYIVQTDISIPGLGGGLRLERVWNSMWPASQSASAVGMFGLNWRSTFEERVFVGSDNTVKYARGDGSFWSFAYDPTTGAEGLAAPTNVQAKLATGSSYWTLTFQNGEKRLFANSSGSLIAIVDRNGNTTQLTYDGSNRLVAVTDPASRHLYFAYIGNSYLATSVTSDFGLSLSYQYDGQQRLTQVTKPDNTTVSFAYDINSMITAVRDSDGKILESHTYDSLGRGLTGSRANGVEAVTVTYPQ